jgi:hypothetical protein
MLAYVRVNFASKLPTFIGRSSASEIDTRNGVEIFEFCENGPRKGNTMKA